MTIEVALPEDLPVSHDAPMDPTIARRMWQVTEPYHAVVYFSPVARERIQAAGLRGFWRGYFATRAAPLGPVPAETVTAVFYNFHPDMVARAIPHVWDLIEPDAAWTARLDAADAALRSELGSGVEGPGIETAADIARQAVAACDPAGRALFASHVHLDWPDQPHLALWQAATMLREFRGDGHNAALTAADVDGCEAHVLADAAGRAPRSQTQPNRGWSDDDWQDARDRLATRGFIATDGTLTAAGASLVEDIEARTNRAALPPWATLGEQSCVELERIMTPFVQRIFDAEWFAQPNPIGLSRTG